MTDNIEIARKFWKEFNLNNSEGAGMKITENGIVTKKYGSDTDIFGHKLMPDSIAFSSSAPLKLTNYRDRLTSRKDR